MKQYTVLLVPLADTLSYQKIGTVLPEDLKGKTQEIQFVMRCEAKC